MIEFSNLEELKTRIEPALLIKAKELNKNSDDIFWYLAEKKWKNAEDLRLFQIIDDIMKLDNLEMSDTR